MTSGVDLETGPVLAAADQLRAAPARLEATLDPHQLARLIGDDLADAVQWSGPHAPVLAAATTVLVDPELAVTATGTGVVRSGGATVDDLAPGVEFGGGRAVGQVSASRRARSHTRRTTRQFGTAQRAIERAVESGADAAADKLADQLLEDVTG